MVEYSKKSLSKSTISAESAQQQYSNPLSAKTVNEMIALGEYTQEQPRPKYDADILDLLEVVKILNNMAPIRMPIYNFNINGFII